MEIIIKFFGLTLNCVYIYIKIMNIRGVSKPKAASAAVFSALAAVIACFFTLPAMDIRPVIILALVIVYFCMAFRVKTNILVTAAVISVGISYGLFGIALAPSAFVFGVLLGMPDNPLISVFILIISLALTNLIFRVNRLKKGFVFLQDTEAGGIGIALSGMVIIAVNLIGIMNPRDAATVVLLLAGIAVCMVGMLFWWRHNLTELYRKRQNEKTIAEQEAALAEKDRQIQEINECSDYLSKLIHRDNKLIPAMYYDVRSFLDSSAKNAGEPIQSEGRRILGELDDIMRERTKMILSNQREHKRLQSTNVELIDSILRFMLLRATESEIEFDFVMTESVERMTETVIPKDKLETLLADLIENAIIAASRTAYRRILLTIGAADGCHEINVQDSGIPFEPQTLFDLGIKKATTHAGEGGSGVGYMAIFEILREAGASLVITEYAPKDYAFSKSVKIRFDGKFKYLIYSFRAAELRAYSDRVNALISNLLRE